jgi:hypothetical protein
MSRLKETNFQGIPGWQWDDGPIFVGEKARDHAVGYGKAVQNLEEWRAYAKLCQDQALSTKRLAELKAIQDARLDKMNMKVPDTLWRFHWLDGTKDEGPGGSMSDAFTRLGFGAGALPALDYYEEVK